MSTDTLAPAEIAEERFADVWLEGQPLLRQHWEEITAYRDIPLDINEAYYRQLDLDGRLCVIAARRDGRLIGYAVFFLQSNPHYAGSLQALEDIFYVHPSARGAMLGLKLIARSDTILRAKGVQVVYHHVKLAHPQLGVLLERRGYAPIETLYAKRLDRG